MIRLVLFDIDGTLLHTGGAGVKAFGQAFEAEFGIDDGTERLKFAGRTDVSLVREFFCHQQIDPTPENFARFFKTYLVFLQRTVIECEGGPCQGAVEFYQTLQKAGQPPLCGLLTGNIKEGARIKLEHYGLWNFFPFGGFADDNEERDHIAAVAMARGGERLKAKLRGDEVLVIGDTPLDIRCGRAIGAKVAAVATGSFSVSALAEHCPDWVVENLSSLNWPEIRG